MFRMTDKNTNALLHNLLRIIFMLNETMLLNPDDNSKKAIKVCVKQLKKIRQNILESIINGNNNKKGGKA